MKKIFSYQTGMASLIQLIIVAILGIPRELVSIINSCQNGKTACFDSLFFSAIIYVLLVVWFSVMAAIGYFAEDTRNPKFAYSIIFCEIITFTIVIFVNFVSETNYILKSVSLIYGLLSLWIIYLAIKLINSHGKRMTRRSR